MPITKGTGAYRAIETNADGAAVRITQHKSSRAWSRGTAGDGGRREGRSGGTGRPKQLGRGNFDFA
jgi:hypothetical protein